MLRAVANPAAGGQPGSFTTLTVSGNATVGGNLTVTGDVSGANYSTPWSDNRQLGGMSFSSTYYARMVGNAATRELRLEAGGATGDPAAVNVRIGVDGTPTTVASFGPTGVAVTGSISATSVSQFSGEAALDIPAAALFGGNSRVSVGFDTANDRGVIGAVNTGVGWKPLALNPVNGAVTVGPGGLQVNASISTTNFIEGAEQTAPAAPAANGYRIFAQDNGAGKTQLMVIFATGAAQQIAIEP